MTVTSALATLAEFHPDIALLDIGMPKMNGYELATEIRKQPWGQAHSARCRDRLGTGQ